MSWEYYTSEFEVGVSIADGYYCWNCKCKCARDNLVLKFYCPKCGDEWSEETVLSVKDKKNAHIKPTIKHFVKFKTTRELKRALRSRKYLYHEGKRLSVKKYLEFLSKFWNVRFIGKEQK